MPKHVSRVWPKHPSPLHSPGNDDGLRGLRLGRPGCAPPLLRALEASTAVWETPRGTSSQLAAVLAEEGPCPGSPRVAPSACPYLPLFLAALTVKTFLCADIQRWTFLSSPKVVIFIKNETLDIQPRRDCIRTQCLGGHYPPQPQSETSQVPANE